MIEEVLENVEMRDESRKEVSGADKEKKNDSIVDREELEKKPVLPS